MKKTRSKADQRVVRISVTPKGKELLAKVKPAGLGMAQGVLEGCFEEKDLKQFDKYMKKVRDAALKKLGKEALPAPSNFRLQKPA